MYIGLHNHLSVSIHPASFTLKHVYYGKKKKLISYDNICFYIALTQSIFIKLNV